MEKINPHHPDHHTGEHELDDGHVQQTQGAELFVVAQHAPLLEQKTEEHSGHQPVEKHLHRSPPP